MFSPEQSTFVPSLPPPCYLRKIFKIDGLGPDFG